MSRASRTERLDYLKDQLRKRVVILDGAMGTNIQKFRLGEEDYRGERFADAARYPNDLKNNNDLLVLTRPDIILDIHRRFLDTGRTDILETCTFGATSIGQHDYFWHRPEEGSHKEQQYFQEVVDAHELKALLALADEAECSPGWSYGETLIHEDYFTDYIEEFINDCYELPKEFNSGDWPWCHMTIDYEAAADEAKQDYREVTLDGQTNYIRG